LDAVRGKHREGEPHEQSESGTEPEKLGAERRRPTDPAHDGSRRRRRHSGDGRDRGGGSGRDTGNVDEHGVVGDDDGHGIGKLVQHGRFRRRRRHDDHDDAVDGGADEDE
jgi:hypothetical protein